MHISISLAFLWLSYGYKMVPDVDYSVLFFFISKFLVEAHNNFLTIFSCLYTL